MLRLNLMTFTVPSSGNSALVLSGSPPDATQGTPYSWTPTRLGGISPVTYSIAAGALPTGLTLNAATGTISGTPTVSGTFAGITLRGVDSSGVPVTFDLAIVLVVISSGGQFDFSDPNQSGLFVLL